MNLKLQLKEKRKPISAYTLRYWWLCRQFHNQEPSNTTVEKAMHELKEIYWSFPQRTLGKLASTLIEQIILNNED